MARKKKATQRQPLWERTLERFVNVFKRLLIPALVIWMIGWLWLGGVFQSTQDMIWNQFIGWSANQGFVVVDVIIEGRHKTDINALQSILNIQKGDPILSVDIGTIQQKINDMPWVKTVKVSRHYNGLIMVQLTERMPFVIWARPGRDHVVIDMDGDVIKRADPKKYKNLLVVRGVNAKNHVVSLLEMIMAEPDLKPYIEVVEWIGDRRWDIITYQKTRVLLPQDDVGHAFARLAKINRDTQILNQGYQSIDLRANDRIIVETKRGKTQDIMNLSSLTKMNSI